MKKETILWFFGVPLLVIVLIVVILLNEPVRDGISRASAYKALALAMTTSEACQEEMTSGESRFSKEDQEQWYAKYMDYLYRQGIISEDLTTADSKTAEGLLTYGETEYLAGQISKQLEKSVKATKRNRNRHFPAEQWWLLYQEILKITDPQEQVVLKELQIQGTIQNVEHAEPWTAYTNAGIMGFEGLSLDPYIDQEIQVQVRDQEMLRIVKPVSDEIVYRNVWIIQAQEDSMEGYLGSIQRTFDVQKELKEPEDMQQHVADLYLEGGKVKKVVLKKETITGKVLEVTENSIEIEGYGEIPLDENFNTYKLYGEFRRQKKSDILVGYEGQEFVVADGKICAALSVRPFDAETIRVLIMDTGFQSLFHENITLKLNDPAVMFIDEKERSLEAGETITLSKGDELLKDGRIVIVPEQEETGIEVTSLERGQGIPVYPGRLEIKEEEEGLVLVNELYLEDYLKRVVPSEMPGNYEKEALKAQAVCARTYAYRQIQGNSYMKYGAHVDDSTRFQVYNNIQTEKSTDEAVDETYGKLLMYQGSPIEAYYFSTSCGHTTDGTVWGADLSSVPHLKGVAVKDGGGVLDLTSNVNFAEFIKNKSYPSYEKGFAMYRWEIYLTSTQLEQKVPDIGRITKVTMKERGTGGIGSVMEIEGTEGVKTIRGQGQIRSVLGNTGSVIKKNDGGTMTGWDTIPSAFIVIERSEPDENQVTTFHIYGGGYGHGVGMSQNGAQGMAKAGMNYQEILMFFFDGVEIKEIGES